MDAGCPCCGGTPVTGVLCVACREAVPPCEGLLPAHVHSRAPGRDVAAWLIDPFGTPHALSATRTTVGRRADADLVIMSASVSRDHAEVQRGDDGWRVRDLGSRNSTVVDGRRVQARAALVDGSHVKFGDVSFVFVGRAVAMPAASVGSISTRHAANGPVRFTVSGDAVELCVVGRETDGDEATGGALLYRPRRRGDREVEWAELSLAPLEFQMLRMLCLRAIEDGDSPSRARGSVSTKQLIKKLPFLSKYANEENVRQVARRVRASLAEVGADGLLEVQPGRGYYLAWPVALG